MCDKCGSKKCGKVRYWLHIADGWTVKEIKEMKVYLERLLMERI